MLQNSKDLAIGEKQQAKIFAFLPGRDDSQCRFGTFTLLIHSATVSLSSNILFVFRWPTFLSCFRQDSGLPVSPIRFYSVLQGLPLGFCHLHSKHPLGYAEVV